MTSQSNQKLSERTFQIVFEKIFVRFLWSFLKTIKMEKFSSRENLDSFIIIQNIPRGTRATLTAN